MNTVLNQIIPGVIQKLEFGKADDQNLSLTKQLLCKHRGDAVRSQSLGWRHSQNQLSNHEGYTFFPGYPLSQDNFLDILQSLSSEALLACTKVCHSWREFISSRKDSHAFFGAALTMQAMNDSFQIESFPENMRTKADWLDASFWRGPQYSYEPTASTWKIDWPAKDHCPRPLSSLIQKNSDFFIELLHTYFTRKFDSIISTQKSIYSIEGNQKRLENSVFTQTLIKKLSQFANVSNLEGICFAWNAIHLISTEPNYGREDFYAKNQVCVLSKLEIFKSVFPTGGEKKQLLGKLQLLCTGVTPKKKGLVLLAFSSVHNFTLYTNMFVDPDLSLLFKDFLMNQIATTGDADFVEIAQQQLVIAMTRILYWHLQQGHGTVHEVFGLNEFSKKIKADILWTLIKFLGDAYVWRGNLEDRNRAVTLFDKLLENSVLRDAVSPSETTENLSILNHCWIDPIIDSFNWKRDLTDALQYKWNIWKEAQTKEELQ